LINKVVMIEEGYPSGIQGRRGRNGRLSSAKIEAANKAGVRAILVVSDDFTDRVARNTASDNTSVTTSLRHVRGANIIYISPRVAARIMKGQEDKVSQYRARYNPIAGVGSSGLSKGTYTAPVAIRKSIEMALHKVTEYEYIPNVVGYLPGKDTELRHEILVLSAHFAHLGIEGEDIDNGADDDGSGVSAILEIGRVISDLSQKKDDFPRRSLLILFANAEEKGLLGSAFYAENPLFPLKNTISNLN